MSERYSEKREEIIAAVHNAGITGVYDDSATTLLSNLGSRCDWSKSSDIEAVRAPSGCVEIRIYRKDTEEVTRTMTLHAHQAWVATALALLAGTQGERGMI